MKVEPEYAQTTGFVISILIFAIVPVRSAQVKSAH